MVKTDDKNKFELQRSEKLQQIKELGEDPYGGRYDKTESAESIKGRFLDDDDSQRAKCAGRIVLLGSQSQSRMWTNILLSL